MQNYGYYNNWQQPGFPQPPENSDNSRLYKYILFAEIFFIVVLAIANIAVKISHFTPNGPSPNSPTPNNNSQTDTLDLSSCKHHTKEEILELVENITKDQAMTIVKNRYSDDNCTVEGLIPKELELRSNESSHEIIYSYDDASEVPSIAADSVMGLSTDLFGNRRSADNFVIDETTDYYTIVSVDDTKVACGELDEHKSTISCYRGISFNKKYLNHYEKVEGYSHNDVIEFNDLSPDFVELALKIIMATDIWNKTSLFDYYFEETEDDFILTGIYFGVGVDMNNLEGASAFNVPYAINIYEKKLDLEKSSKEYGWLKFDSDYGEGTSSHNIKSFSLSDDDLIDINAAMYGLSDEEVEELKKENQNKKDDDDLTDAERLEARASAICGKDYSLVFKASDNSGIYKCNDYTNAIYSIANSDRSESEYQHLAHATYLGTNDDETVNQFFKDKLYIYQDYRYSGVPHQLILLFESPSEKALVENNLDAIYSYIKKSNEKDATDLNLYIFYNEDLSGVKSLKDYVLLAGVAGYNTWLPNGNGFGQYIYLKEDEVTAINKLANNPDLYSSQTRNAIKFNRHIEAVIKKDETITKTSLKKLLNNSFKSGL